MNQVPNTVDTTICVGRELLRSVQAFVRGLECRLSNMECCLNCVGIGEDLYDLRRQLGLTEYEHYVRSSIESIYLTATQPLSGELSEIEERQLDSAEQFDIRAQMIDGSIVARLPMLGSMYRRRADGPRPYGHVFAAEVEAVVRKLVSAMAPEDTERYRTKTLTYFFVYSKNERYVLDSDNHDTKAITDAVCAPFLSTDSGSSTVFCYKTIITDSLQPGTYIVLTPGVGSIPDLGILESFREEENNDDNYTEDPV